jgi:hypothetical protein
MEESKTKQCSTCKKIHEISDFIGVKGNETKTCKHCREQNKKNDANRDKTHRNAVARKNDAKPERKLVKKIWNENNHEKVALKSMNYRQRKIAKVGIIEYLKQNAEMAKKWRDNNPDKMIQANENKKNNRKQNYNTYKRTANLKQLDFSISFEEYLLLTEKECYYCSVIQNNGFNGIDRKDQTLGYEVNNCVACCKMCNYIKGSLSEQTFLKRITNILSHNNIICGKFYPNSFSNHKKTSYNGYKSRANKKQIDFEINETEFHNIISNPCYLCGKKNSETHSNGIDRIDNSIGYIISNLQTCCGECNYMKKDYHIDEFMNKLKMIYDNKKMDISIENETCENIIGRSNKKSKIQIAEEREFRKQNQQNNLINKYNNEEYKKMRSLELAKNRE